MHILKVREALGGCLLTPTLDPRLQYWVRKGIYTCMYEYWEIYVCRWGDGLGKERGGDLEIENGNG